MTAPEQSKPREPILQRLRRLGIKPSTGPSKPVIRTRRNRLYEDENMFSRRPATDKTK